MIFPKSCMMFYFLKNQIEMFKRKEERLSHAEKAWECRQIIMKIKEMEQGSNEIYLMLKRMEERKTKNGKPYLILELTDGQDDLMAKLWGTGKDDFPAEPGTVLSCDMRCGEFGGKPDYTLDHYRIADETETSAKDFIKLPPFDTESMYSDIMSKINQIENEEIRILTRDIYEDYKEKILHASAAVSVHHNICGGLLYHTYRMMFAGFYLCYVYTKADPSLVVGGCLLHDIGKLFTMDTDPFGNATFTVDGNLYEHLYLGAEVLDKYIRKNNISTEVARNLKHIILSHHEEPEYGAVVRPCTLEAFIVSQIDYLDSKAYIFEETLKNMDPGTFTDGKVFGLDAHVYKKEM